jgi:hypothetical protein
MLGGRRSREGDILPGFDCQTGKAVGYNHEQWKRLCKDHPWKQYPGYIRVYDRATRTPMYEIFTEVNFL